jgi:hypothetical protein
MPRPERKAEMSDLELILKEEITRLNNDVTRLDHELAKTISLLGKERDEWRKLETEIMADCNRWKSVAGKYRVALEKMPHEFYCFRLSPIKGGENSECNCLKAALRDDGEEKS